MENNINEVFKSLQQLENSLQQLDTARQQVESVVHAAESTNGALADYTQTLGELTQAMNQYVTAVKECNSTIADSSRIGELSGMLEEKISALNAAANDADRWANIDAKLDALQLHATNDDLSSAPVNTACDEKLDALEMKIDALLARPTQPENNGGNNEAIEAKIDSLLARPVPEYATISVDNSNVQQALADFDQRLTAISKEVMVMRNSTHSILKNMESLLAERSSREGRTARIIAIVALVLAIVILLRLFGVL